MHKVRQMHTLKSGYGKHPLNKNYIKITCLKMHKIHQMQPWKKWVGKRTENTLNALWKKELEKNYLPEIHKVHKMHTWKSVLEKKLKIGFPENMLKNWITQSA